MPILLAFLILFYNTPAVLSSDMPDDISVSTASYGVEQSYDEPCNIYQNVSPENFPVNHSSGPAVIVAQSSYNDNLFLCNSEPDGPPCKPRMLDCISNEISGANYNERIHIYYESHDVVHGDRYDYYIQMDGIEKGAKNPEDASQIIYDAGNAERNLLIVIGEDSNKLGSVITAYPVPK